MNKTLRAAMAAAALMTAGEACWAQQFAVWLDGNNTPGGGGNPILAEIDQYFGPGHYTLVTTAQLETAGFLNTFDALVVSRFDAAFGTALSAAAAANVQTYVGSGATQGGVALFSNDVADNLFGAVFDPYDPNLDALFRNALQFAAATHHGYIGEFNGAVMGVTANTAGYPALGLLAGTASAVRGYGPQFLYDVGPIGPGNPIDSGVTFPFTDSDSSTFLTDITGADPNNIVDIYTSAGISGEPAVLANQAVISGGNPAANPTTTTVNSPTVQYSDNVTLTATVSPNTAAGSVQFQVNGTDVGSPVTVSSGTATLTTQILLPQGSSYGITASFTSSDPTLANSQGDGTLTVTLEDASVAPNPNNPTAVKVNTAGGTAGPIVLTASITELQNGPGQVTGTTDSLGDICLATPVTITLTPIVGGGALSVPAAVVVSCDGTTLVVQGTFNNVPVNVYQVSYTIGGNYYTGTGTSVLAVYDPSLGFVTGGGIINHGGGVLGNFGVTAKYVGKNGVQGSVLYIEHRPTGDVRIKSNAMQTLSVVGNTAVILAKATVNGVGNYSIQAVLVDNGEPGTGADQFGLQVVDKTGAIVPGLTFAPITLSGGNIVVPHK